MKILKFSASWCLPCKQLSSTIQSLSDDKRALFEDIDVDACTKDVLTKYNIGSVPTLVFLDDKSNPVKIMTGHKTKQQLDQVINELQTDYNRKA
jgi:thioredoxin 1